MGRLGPSLLGIVKPAASVTVKSLIAQFPCCKWGSQTDSTIVIPVGSFNWSVYRENIHSSYCNRKRNLETFVGTRSSSRRMTPGKRSWLLTSSNPPPFQPETKHTTKTNKIITHKYWHQDTCRVTTPLQYPFHRAVATFQQISFNDWFLSETSKKEVWLFKLRPNIELTKPSYGKQHKLIEMSKGTKTYQRKCF